MTDTNMDRFFPFRHAATIKWLGPGVAWLIGHEAEERKERQREPLERSGPSGQWVCIASGTSKPVEADIGTVLVGKGGTGP